MWKKLCILILVLFFLNGCVIHLKPGLSWCTSKQCIYDAYGLYKVKDFSRRKRMQVAGWERKIKKDFRHHSGDPSHVTASRTIRSRESKTSADVSGQALPPAEKKDTAVVKDALKTSLRITFPFDQDTISVQEKKDIQDFMQQVPLGQISTILIKGFTDNAGSEVYNRHLSIRRAKRVHDYLLELNISRSLLSFKGFDFKDPVADNKTEEGRSLNRRVEIELILKSQ